MTGRPDQTELDRFLTTDPGDRADIDLTRVLEDLEAIVHRDAERVAESAPLVAEHARSCSEGGRAASALRFSVTANAYLGRHEIALELSDEARRLATDSGDQVEAARALVAGMQSLCETGRIEQAIDDGEQAREELNSASEPQLAARVDLNLGNVHKMRGDAERALLHLDRVIEVLPREDPIHPHVLNAVGECRYLLDDHVGADTAFSDALELLGEDPGLAGGVLMGNRADVASREGRLQDAIDLFAEARTRLEHLGASSHVARLIVESADVLEVAGLHEEARAELENGLERVIASGLPFENARARFALGRLHVQAGRFNQAQKDFDQAIELFKSVDNDRHANRCLLASVEAAIAADQHDQASIRLDAIRPLIDGPWERALFAHHQGLLHEAEGRLEEAVESAERACREAKELGIRPFSADLAARHCQLLVETQRIEEAIEVGRAATEEIEGIRASFHGERLRAAFLASRLTAHEAYVGALLASGGDDNLRLAFETVEKARNRGLIERINRQLEGSHKAELDDPVTVDLKRRLNALYAALARDGLEDQRRLRSGSRQREIDSLELRLDRHLLEVDTATRPTEDSFSYTEVLETLDEETALLEFFVIEDDLVIFTVHKGRLEVAVEPNAMSRIEELIDEFHFQCRRRLRGTPGPQLEQRMHAACLEILQNLNDALLARINGGLFEARKWLIVPFGPLLSVPFHALHDGERHLLDRVTLASAPSAAAAMKLSRVKSSGKGALVASIADELAPAIRHEGDEVAARYDTTDGAVIRLDGEAATAEQLKEALTKVNIAHIACHGRFLSGSPRSSGLRMSDRWLTVRDIHELASTPEIVILSGCETGLNPTDGADELHGLTQGFTGNGTSAVVASLWSVHDAASTRLMTRMHERLSAQSGTPHGVAEALRQAQIELRDESSHPAFWAAFFCSESTFGRTNRDERHETARGGDVTCTN